METEDVDRIWIKDVNNTIKVFPENENLKILNGRFGPYIVADKKNYRIPKSLDASQLTLQDALDIVAGKKMDGEKKYSLLIVDDRASNIIALANILKPALSRGEIQVILLNAGKEPFVIRRGDRIAQMVVARVERVAFTLTERIEEDEKAEK